MTNNQKTIWLVWNIFSAGMAVIFDNPYIAVGYMVIQAFILYKLWIGYKNRASKVSVTK